MATVRPTTKFKRRLKKLDEARYNAVVEAVARFCDNPRHPGLCFEKVKGTDYSSIRVDGGWRLVMRRSDTETYDLIDVGNHDIYDKY